MSGRHVSVIVHYGADAGGLPYVTREIYWPMLRTKPLDVRGYLRRAYEDHAIPRVLADGKALTSAPLLRVRFDGILTLEQRETDGLVITRRFFPSLDKPAVFELWTVLNRAKTPVRLEIAPRESRETDKGVYGDYVIETSVEPSGQILINPAAQGSFAFVFHARRASTPRPVFAPKAQEEARVAFLRKISSSLRLVTPDPVLNQAFTFAKQRTTQSIFETAMGLVHSPGGRSYYGGVWANDQAEYAGPFFPYLGDDTANHASLNAYRIFARAMKPDYSPIPSSFEVEGEVPYTLCGDRGDAAMVAYGASLFALTLGDRAVAEELWTPIQWCLEYCRRKTLPAGVVASDTDELEGRYGAGEANLSTSTLAYGALTFAAALGKSLGKKEVKDYARRAEKLEAAIEHYFGATVQGYDTYRYYEANTTLRSWICLPLCMGIFRRKAGTISALFSPNLWTEDGLATEAGREAFWDRETLYAFRSVFIAGETETAFGHLRSYSVRRLLGEHVPYPVEGYPEGNQAQMAAESALYCRIFTEGMFGIRPTGLRSFRCAPRLPAGWNEMSLERIHAFANVWDLRVSREGSKIRLVAVADGKIIFEGTQPEGAAFDVVLP